QRGVRHDHDALASHRRRLLEARPGEPQRRRRGGRRRRVLPCGGARRGRRGRRWGRPAARLGASRRETNEGRDAEARRGAEARMWVHAAIRITLPEIRAGRCKMAAISNQDLPERRSVDTPARIACHVRMTRALTFGASLITTSLLLMSTPAGATKYSL